MMAGLYDLLKRPRDLMGAREQAAYRDAVGAPISAPLNAPMAMPLNQPIASHGVVVPPQNIVGLAALLLRTGRAVDQIGAMRMAQEMTNGAR